MADNFKFIFYMAIVGVCMSVSSPIMAEERTGVASFDSERDDSLYYQPPAYRPDSRAIVHQKAQARAQQRQARLASLSWYGISNGRPATASTPFTSPYSPVWQMPGGRPYFAWYTGTWPSYVVYMR